jgi:hypothetical protein
MKGDSNINEISVTVTNRKAPRRILSQEGNSFLYSLKYRPVAYAPPRIRQKRINQKGYSVKIFQPNRGSI